MYSGKLPPPEGKVSSVGLDEKDFYIAMSPEFKKAIDKAFVDLVVFGEAMYPIPTDKDVTIITGTKERI